MRRALLCVVPAALVLTGWLGVEEPVAGGGRALLLVAIALVPALLRSRWMRACAALAAALAASWIAVGVSFLQLPQDFFAQLGSRFWNGVLEFYEVRLPFDPVRHPRMQEAVLAGVFLFCLALGLAIAARRPLLAAATLVLGAGWPVTLLPGNAALLRGGLILGAVLLLLAGMGRRGGRRPAAALVVGGLAVACALGASASPAIAKGEFLHWQNWNFSPTEKPVSVSFVWRSNYSGLDWPRKVTDVLKIHTGPVARYWRATTLDDFRDDHWLEDLTTTKVSVASGTDVLPTVDALPPAARQRRTWVRQRVTVEHLQDDHLVGASVPVAYEHHAYAAISYAQAGLARVTPGLEAGDRYTVWSYASQPSPAQLARSKPRYPRSLRTHDLGIWVDTWAGPFGSQRSRQFVAEMIRSGRVPRPYGILYRTARQVVGHARTPYAAVVTLESWFRQGGGFTYDNHPPSIPGVPPLVSFLETRRGYCQHFAGAMALMLRYLGIPARVAVGFTSGSYDRGAHDWTVTDHDAHAWVEVWFRGYGWLPFDPTPGRGSLAAPYSSASKLFDASAAAVAAKGAPKGVLGILEQRARAEAHAHKNLFQSERPFAVTSGSSVTRHGIGARAKSTLAGLLELLALAAAGVLLSIALVKLLRRRVRYATRDPRRFGAACRRELVETLLDQRFEVSRAATLGDLARILREELGVAADTFAAAAAEARFGTPPHAKDAAAVAKQELGRLRLDLRRRLSSAERLRGAVSLRSLRSA